MLICGLPLRFRLSKIEFQSYFSSTSQYLFSTEYAIFLNAGKFWELDPLGLNLREIQQYIIIYYPLNTSTYEILRLNVRTISTVYLNIIIHWITFSDCCIRVTVLLEYFDLVWWFQGKMPQFPPFLWPCVYRNSIV